MFFAAIIKIIHMRKILTVTLVLLFSLLTAEGQQNRAEVLEQLEQERQIQQQQPDRKSVV